MRKYLLPFLLSVYVVTSAAFSHEPQNSNTTDIRHILESYSERTGTQFILDPRVRAGVNTVGVDLDEISQTNLMDILLIHSFTAYERDGVVHVLPQAAADHLGEKIGPIWGAE